MSTSAMRRFVVVSLASVVVVGLAICGTSSTTADSGRATPQTEATVVIAIGEQTPVYDMGVRRMGGEPIGWQDVSYGDASWTYARRVPSTILSCTIDKYGQPMNDTDGNPLTLYWGTDQKHGYLFRQSFTLPQANSFDASYDIDLPYLSDSAALYVNGSLVDTFSPNTDMNSVAHGTQLTVSGAVGHLRAGQNVIAAYVPPASIADVGKPCSAFGLDLAIDAHSVVPAATALPRPTPVPSFGLIVPLRPASGAAVSGPTLTLAWSAYHHATAYDIQLWLVQAATGQALSAHSSSVVSRRVQAARLVLATAGLVPGTYHWRVVATDRTGTLITVWTPDQVLRLRTD